MAGVWPIVALCAVITALGGFWYAIEGWPTVNHWLRQRLASTAAPSNDLPILALQIDTSAFRALERQRASAIERGIWIPNATDWQPVQIQSGRETVPARVRLDGGPAEHGQTDKWTLLVELEDNATLLGMGSFTLCSPAASGYLNGWLYAETLRRAGIHAPQHAFANVSANGDDWGVYAVVEHISARSLAAGRQAEGVIVRFNVPPLTAEADVPLLAEIEVSNDRDSMDGPEESGASAAARILVRDLQERRLAPSEAFDPAQIGRHLAHVDLWGSGDRLGWQARRFYYDPMTARLEPIAEEVPAPEVTRTFAPSLTAAHDLHVAEAYVAEALRLSAPGHLDALRESASQFERYRAALANEFFPAYLAPPWQVLTDRQTLLGKALHPAQPIQAYRVDLQSEPVTELQLANLLPYPVALVSLQMGDRQLDVRPEWVVEADWDALHEEARPTVILKGIQATIPRYITLRIPSSALTLPLPDVLQITTRLVGLSNAVTVDVHKVPHRPWPESSPPIQPGLQEVLSQHPYLSTAEQPGYLAVAPGTWHVRGDMILPDGLGLWASQPVTLTFERGAMLLTSGPLMLQGTDRDLVRLLPQEDEWAGVVVYRAGQGAPSSLDQVEIRGTSGLTHDGWHLPGGLTFYESPVAMRGSRLWGSTAPAALYVRGTAFVLTDTELGQALFDGFRGDLAQGQMERCTIHDVLGHGIALSRSLLGLYNTALLRIGGEGVSSTSGSEVRARGIWSQDTGIAFASKDSSLIEIQDARIAQAWRAAFAASLLEQAYGPSSIDASRILFEDDSPRVWLQEGCNITLEDTRAPAAEPGAIVLAPRYELPPTARIEHYRFGPALRLVGYDLPHERFRSGTTLPLTLYWQASAKLGTDYTVFVHVLSSTGEIAAQWDAMPQQDTFPTTGWPVGEMVGDPHPVPLPEGMPAGSYRIALGVYDRQTADRLPAFGPDGEPIANAAVLLERVAEVE